ncbi:hypothetical protein F5141DRAFT_710132 [Pisolithus sp. B1]|nr:hypothetical protein F5141DRAFT_710132 [Pisolithus sp. B1]
MVRVRYLSLSAFGFFCLSACGTCSVTTVSTVYMSLRVKIRYHAGRTILSSPSPSRGCVFLIRSMPCADKSLLWDLAKSNIFQL